MTPEQIAAGLTKAQRERLRSAEPYVGVWLVRSPNGHSPKENFPKGLSLYWNKNYDTLTPLGEQVRAILEKNNERG